MPRLLAVAFIWGWSFLLIKVALEGAPPSFIAWSRVVLGAAVLIPILRHAGERILPPRTQWLHGLVLGLFSSALPFTLIAWGEQRITSALAASCQQRLRVRAPDLHTYSSVPPLGTC